MNLNRGFSLIEVLVTLALTSVGVLGMLALQTLSISHTQITQQHESAISAADELVEILRVYRDQFYHLVPSGTEAPPSSHGEFYQQLKSSTALYSGGKALFSAENCSADPQGAVAMAGCWLQQQESILPDFSVSRLCPSHSKESCTGGSALVLGLSWRSKDELCSEGICAYSVRVEL